MYLYTLIKRSGTLVAIPYQGNSQVWLALSRDIICESVLGIPSVS